MPHKLKDMGVLKPKEAVRCINTEQANFVIKNERAIGDRYTLKSEDFHKENQCIFYGGSHSGVSYAIRNDYKIIEYSEFEQRLNPDKTIEPPFKNYNEITYNLITTHPYFLTITPYKLHNIIDHMDQNGYLRIYEEKPVDINATEYVISLLKGKKDNLVELIDKKWYYNKITNSFCIKDGIKSYFLSGTDWHVEERFNHIFKHYREAEKEEVQKALSKYAKYHYKEGTTTIGMASGTKYNIKSNHKINFLSYDVMAGSLLCIFDNDKLQWAEIVKQEHNIKKEKGALINRWYRGTKNTKKLVYYQGSNVRTYGLAYDSKWIDYYEFDNNILANEFRLISYKEAGEMLVEYAKKRYKDKHLYTGLLDGEVRNINHNEIEFHNEIGEGLMLSCDKYDLLYHKGKWASAGYGTNSVSCSGTDGVSHALSPPEPVFEKSPPTLNHNNNLILEEKVISIKTKKKNKRSKSSKLLIIKQK